VKKKWTADKLASALETAMAKPKAERTVEETRAIYVAKNNKRSRESRDERNRKRRLDYNEKKKTKQTADGVAVTGTRLYRRKVKRETLSASGDDTDGSGSGSAHERAQERAKGLD